MGEKKTGKEGREGVLKGKERSSELGRRLPPGAKGGWTLLNRRAFSLLNTAEKARIFRNINLHCALFTIIL